eukprot:1275327-Rhodomonas_salina.1
MTPLEKACHQEHRMTEKFGASEVHRWWKPLWLHRPGLRFHRSPEPIVRFGRIPQPLRCLNADRESSLQILSCNTGSRILQQSSTDRASPKPEMAAAEKRPEHPAALFPRKGF